MQEDPEVGAVFPDVGMRLSVGDWLSSWLCGEEGLSMPGHDFKLVIAESLPGTANSHVDSFLAAHGGPGIQVNPPNISGQEIVLVLVRGHA